MSQFLDVSFAGRTFQLRPSGALFDEAASRLILADLHLEKGSFFDRNGVRLPPYDSEETLRLLGAEIDATGARCVICLGDSFHDRVAAMRLSTTNAQTLQRLASGREWIWVQGNHDSECLTSSQPLLPGRVVPFIIEDALAMRHEPTGEGPEIVGHYHPKATLLLPRRKVSAKCFLLTAQLLIVPAFGVYTGGLDVFHPLLRARAGQNFRVVLVLANRLVAAHPKRLLKRRIYTI
jgi:DNA ligase-associated metallophosphoesterase